MQVLLTDQQLISDGWSDSLLRSEIQAGRLPGRLTGTGFVVAQSDLVNWHQGQPGQQSGRQAAHQAPAATGTARARFDAAVEAAMETGLSRQAATRQVVESQPQLQAAMLQEHNRDRVRRDL